MLSHKKNRLIAATDKKIYFSENGNLSQEYGLSELSLAQFLSHEYDSRLLSTFHIGGVFIETDQRVPVGETVILNFNLPSFSQPFTLPGKVAWSGPQGFGVKFDLVPSSQGRAIKAYVEKQK